MSDPTDQRMIAELVARVLARHESLAESAGVSSETNLWKQLEELGLTLAAVPESLGGAGGSLQDQLTILRTAGASACPAPLLETALGGWLLAGAGLRVEPGPMAIIPGGFSDRIQVLGTGEAATLAGSSTATSGLQQAEHLVVSGRDATGQAFVAALDPEVLLSQRGIRSAGTIRVTIELDGVRASVAPVDDETGPEQLRSRAALGRCLMIAGALESIRDLTVAYAAGRRQFGRPLRTFQAVQQHLAVAARECALADAVTRMAADTLVHDGSADLTEVAAAKVVCSQAAGTVSAIAHQVHGAIGITREHRLPALTRAVLAWRSDFGGERVWAQALSRSLRDGDLWDRVTATGQISQNGSVCRGM